MNLEITATVNPKVESPLAFWVGQDPLNNSQESVFALRKGIFTVFYQFSSQGERFFSAGEVRGAIQKGSILTVKLGIEVATVREQKDLDGFKGHWENLPESYRADLSQEPAFQNFYVPHEEQKPAASDALPKTLQNTIDEKRADLRAVRQLILDAQADEDEALLAELRPQRDRLKGELEVLEAQNG